MESSLDFRNTDRAIRSYAHSLRCINVELVVIKKDNTGKGTSEVGENMLECRASGLEVADLVRQVVVVQETVEP